MEELLESLELEKSSYHMGLSRVSGVTHMSTGRKLLKSLPGPVLKSHSSLLFGCCIFYYVLISPSVLFAAFANSALPPYYKIKSSSSFLLLLLLCQRQIFICVSTGAVLAVITEQSLSASHFLSFLTA